MRNSEAEPDTAAQAACYAAYTVYLTLHAIDHPALESYRTAMVYFVLPLTAVTLIVMMVRAVRGGRGA